MIGDILLIGSQVGAKQCNVQDISLRDWTLKLWQWWTFPHRLFTSYVTFFFPFLSLLVLHFYKDWNKCVTLSKQSPRDAGDRGDLWSLCTLMQTLFTLHRSSAPESTIWVSVRGAVLSRKHTEIHTNTEARRRGEKNCVLFSLWHRDLETVAVIGRKTMEHFSSSSEEALPGSRSVTSLPTSRSCEGRDRWRERVCCGLCDRKCTVGLRSWRPVEVHCIRGMQHTCYFISIFHNV